MAASADANRLLDATLRELLARLLDARSADVEADPWIVADSPRCPIPWRRIVDAARRGELVASRIGRRVVVRASELDAWIARQRIEPQAQKKAEAAAPSAVAHILAGAGYSRRAAVGGDHG